MNGDPKSRNMEEGMGRFLRSVGIAMTLLVLAIGLSMMAIATHSPPVMEISAVDTGPPAEIALAENVALKPAGVRGAMVLNYETDKAVWAIRDENDIGLGHIILCAHMSDADPDTAISAERRAPEVINTSRQNTSSFQISFRI